MDFMELFSKKNGKLIKSKKKHNKMKPKKTKIRHSFLFACFGN